MPVIYSAHDRSSVPDKSASNQYGDGHPIPSASGIGGATAVAISTSAMFPAKTDSTFITEHGVDAPDKLNTRPHLSASGVSHATAVGLTDSFGAGSSSEKVIDHEDAPFVLGTDPFLDSGV